MKDLWIVGGSGAALEVWAVAKAMAPQPWRLRGFLDVNASVDFDPEGLEVCEESAFLASPEAASSLVVLALGDPTLRAKVARRYASVGLGFATLVHPSAIVGPHCTLGQGSVLMAQAVLETHVQVGHHALINVGCSIAHNGVLGDCCSLGPGVRLAGWVTLGDGCDLGVGCCIRPKIVLGAGTRVGAGAAVVQDHPGGTTLVGVPARPLKTR